MSADYERGYAAALAEVRTKVEAIDHPCHDVCVGRMHADCQCAAYVRQEVLALLAAPAPSEPTYEELVAEAMQPLAPSEPDPEAVRALNIAVERGDRRAFEAAWAALVAPAPSDGLREAAQAVVDAEREGPREDETTVRFAMRMGDLIAALRAALRGEQR